MHIVIKIEPHECSFYLQHLEAMVVVRAHWAAPTGIRTCWGSLRTHKTKYARRNECFHLDPSMIQVQNQRFYDFCWSFGGMHWDPIFHTDKYAQIGTFISKLIQKNPKQGQEWKWIQNSNTHWLQRLTMTCINKLKALCWVWLMSPKRCQTKNFLFRQSTKCQSAKLWLLFEYSSSLNCMEHVRMVLNKSPTTKMLECVI
jgi:hypothetical protein